MGMLDLLLGRKREVPAKPRNSRTSPNTTQFAASQLPPGSGSPHAVRKDVLKLVLRELLTRNGIPQTWITAEMLRTTSPRREQGLHVRFLIRQWDPRLMHHGPAFEGEFLQRLLMLDPLAGDWLMGFSWQFALEDTSACPQLPHPGSWTAPPPAPTPDACAPMTKPGDIIEGPVVIPRGANGVRADLEQLLALRDEDIRRHAKGGDNFAATRPATL
jgi:hypothetical protein